MNPNSIKLLCYLADHGPSYRARMIREGAGIPHRIVSCIVIHALENRWVRYAPAKSHDQRAQWIEITDAGRRALEAECGN